MWYGLGIIAAFLSLSACGPNVSSSELKETTADALKITATVLEENGNSRASVDAIMKTIPDDVGIEFNQGETLSVAVEDEDETRSEDIFLSYDENLFDLDEGYTTNVTKPPLGKKYYITYTDSEDLATTATFYSQGVPDLLTPIDGQVLPLGSVTTLTWNKQGLGNLRVKVYYDTLEGGVAYTDLPASDTGSYALNLGSDSFDQAAPGQATIILEHKTSFDDADGFGDTDIDVVSRSVVDVVFQAKNGE